MDTKLGIKAEDPLSDDIFSQNERESMTKHVALKANSDIVLLDDDCDVAIKTKIKSETPFPDLSSQKECCTKHAPKQISAETVTCSSCEIYIKSEVEEETLISDFGSQNNKEFFPENPVAMVKKCSSDHEMVEIKVEPWWLETQTSGCGDVKEGDFPPEKCSRLCTKAASSDSSGESPMPSDVVSGGETSFYNLIDHSENEVKAGYDEEILIPDEHFQLEEYGKQSDKGESCNRSLHLKQKALNHECERPHKCNICDKSFTQLSHLKRHNNLIHEGKKSYQCKSCVKSFTDLSNLKMHNLIHEGKKPHQCTSCDKSFTQLSNLKTHILTHEGKKPYQCKACDKNFTKLSNLKRHNLIHEDKKPHKCKMCDKSFTQLSSLKMHNMAHEGKKPHKCKICDKSFTWLSSLKAHNLFHQGKKPQQ